MVLFEKNSLGNNVAGLPLSDLEVFPDQEGAACQDDCYSESLAARTTPVWLSLVGQA